MEVSKASVSLVQRKPSVCVQSCCRLPARAPRPTAVTGLLRAIPIHPAHPSCLPSAEGPILGPEVPVRARRFAPGFTPSPARPSAAAIQHVCRPSPGGRRTERPQGLPGPAASRRHVNGGRGGLGDAAQGQARPSRAVPALPALRYPPRGEEHDEVRGGGGAVPQHLGAVEVPRVRVRLRLRLGPHRPSAKHGAERGPGKQAAPGRAGAQRSHGSDEAASSEKPRAAAAASLPARPPPPAPPSVPPAPQPFAPAPGCVGKWSG